MSKLGMEPIRRAALIKATIDSIGQGGSLDVTVSQFAKRTDMSSALAHHYFGAKEQMFLAAMRLLAIIRASFLAEQFKDHVVSAWLNFYVQAQISTGAQRLLTVYQRRLRSNLVFHLRPLVGNRAGAVADTIATLIDGLYIRAALSPDHPDPQAVAARVCSLLDLMIEEVT